MVKEPDSLLFFIYLFIFFVKTTWHTVRLQTRDSAASKAEETGRVEMQPRQAGSSRSADADARSALSQHDSHIAGSHFRQEQTADALVLEREQRGTIERQHVRRSGEAPAVGPVREWPGGSRPADVSGERGPQVPESLLQRAAPISASLESRHVAGSVVQFAQPSRGGLSRGHAQCQKPEPEGQSTVVAAARPEIGDVEDTGRTKEQARRVAQRQLHRTTIVA